MEQQPEFKFVEELDKGQGETSPEKKTPAESLKPIQETSVEESERIRCQYCQDDGSLCKFCGSGRR